MPACPIDELVSPPPLAPARALTAETAAAHELFFPKMLDALDSVHEPSMDVLEAAVTEDVLVDSRDLEQNIDISTWQPTDPLYMVERYDPVEISFPITWTLNPYSDNNWQHGFNSLRWVWSLIGAGDDESLSTALVVIDDWLRQNSHWPRTLSPYQWGDHTSALRLETKVRAYRAYAGSGLRDDAFRERLLAGIASHITTPS